MDKILAALCALVLLATIIPDAVATCVPATSTPEYDSDRDTEGVVDLVNGEIGVFPPASSHHQFYVENDVCQLDMCGFSLWVYEETNAHAGLQRNDAFAGDQTCGLYSADTIVFP